MSGNYLQINLYDNPSLAPHYNRDTPDIRSAELHTCAIVGRGTMGGKPTVDFQFRTLDGAEFVAMLTGELIKALAQAVQGMEERTKG